MNSYHSDVDKSRISIAESNLTTSESSLSDSSSSPMTSPRNDVIEGGETRDVTPKDPSPVQAPQPAQGKMSSAKAGRASQLRKSAESPSPAQKVAKGTTPYGQIVTKNGYFMVGKLTSARSRHTSKTSSARPEKVDPITARILSANRAKRQIAGNQAGEIKRKNMQLYEEIKSLRILCRNQEKSLKQFESTQSALPRVLQNFEHDKAILKERLRKTKDSEKRLEREKKRLDIENEKNQKKIKELNNIIQNKNLDERWNLQQQLTAAENRAQEAEGRLRELDRKMELQQAALERQLKKEIRRRVRAENENQKNRDDMRTIQEKLNEKEKQLNYTNIYIQRQSKGSKKQRKTVVNFGCKSVQTSPRTIVNPVRSEPIFAPVKDLCPKLAKSAENSATLPDILPEKNSPDFFSSPLPPLEPKTVPVESPAKSPVALTLDELLNRPLLDFETPLEPPSTVNPLETPRKSPLDKFPNTEPSFSEIDQVLGLTPKKPEAPKVKFFVFDDSISKEKWNTSLALAPAPTLDSSTVSAPVIGRGPTPTVQKSVELTGAGEGIVVNFGGYKTVVAKEPEPEVALEQKPSSTFLTDLADNNEPADLNDFSTPDVPVVSARVNEVVETPPPMEPTGTSSPKVITPREPTPEVKKPEKTADALLDEMLFGNEKPVAEPVKEKSPSPNLFDLDTKVSVERQDSVPEFDFGSEAARKTSKDSILAELADLHDEPRSKPSIDPLEKPNKEDELDALLKLNAPKRTTTTTSNQAKKSNPIVYNFTEPIENLHLGLSSSGKDFSRTTTAKKENLIDNLFGGGN